MLGFVADSMAVGKAVSWKIEKRKARIAKAL
jgi:hypothetical protein